MGCQNFLHVGDGISAAADVQKGAYDGTDHVAEKTIGRNCKNQIISWFRRIIHYTGMGGNIGFPAGLEDGADGSFAVASGLLETAEIVGSQKTLTGLIHGLNIQRISVQIRVRTGERVLLPVNEIVIPSKAGVEARMEVIGRNFHFVNHHGGRQNGI